MTGLIFRFASTNSMWNWRLPNASCAQSMPSCRRWSISTRRPWSRRKLSLARTRSSTVRRILHLDGDSFEISTYHKWWFQTNCTRQRRLSPMPTASSTSWIWRTPAWPERSESSRPLSRRPTPREETPRTALSELSPNSKLSASKWREDSRRKYDEIHYPSQTICDGCHLQEEELEALRKNMQFEIDRLTAALADAEARMKVGGRKSIAIY